MVPRTGTDSVLPSNELIIKWGQAYGVRIQHVTAVGTWEQGQGGVQYPRPVSGSLEEVYLKEKVKLKLIRGRRRKETARQKRKKQLCFWKVKKKARMLEDSMHGRTQQGVSVGTEGGAEWRLS